jgi:hypothetical protein
MLSKIYEILPSRVLPISLLYYVHPHLIHLLLSLCPVGCQFVGVRSGHLMRRDISLLVVLLAAAKPYHRVVNTISRNDLYNLRVLFI